MRILLALAAALAAFTAHATLLGADTRIGDITVIEADPVVLQPGEAFDLNGKTVTLSPRSGGGYTPTTGPLNFDSATGSPLSGVGDDTSTSVALGFSFPFLGFSWTSVWVNSNGHLTFGLPSGEFHFYSGGVNRLSADSDLSGILDRMAFNRARVAALWQDWNPSAGGAVLANALSNRVVLTWSGVPLYSTQGNPATVPVTATFQAVLFKSGVMQFNYQNVAATPAGGYLVGVSPGGVSEFETTTVDFSRGGSSISAFPTFEPLAQVFGSMSAPFSPPSPAPRGPLVHINAVAGKFYALNPDSTDQIVMLANFTHSLGNALAYELTVRQTVAGIGQGAPDTSTGISSFFGSGGTLTSFINMNRLGVWNNDPAARTYGTDSMLSIMGQETGHQWLSFLRYDDGATCNSALLGRDQAHWSFFMDSDASDMEGNDWRDNGNGTFTTVDATSRFSLLDQYAMGLVPASSVPNTFFIQNPTVTSPAGTTRTASSSPELNVTASGTRVNVTINQIVSSRCNVPRSPASGFTAVNPTDRWRQSFVLLIPAGTSAPQADLNKIDGFRSAWTSYFLAATDGRGSVNTSSSAVPATPGAMQARACYGAKVNVTWTDTSTNETSFKLERKSGASGTYATIATVASNRTQYLDSAVAAGTTFFYRIRASNAAGDSGFSGEASASTAVAAPFTDDPLSAGTTLVKAAHMSELRTAVNAVRSCAGLAGSAWTDSTLSGVAVKAVHVQELRDGLNPALAAIGVSLPAYSNNPIVPAVTPVRSAHIQELRQAVQ